MKYPRYFCIEWFVLKGAGIKKNGAPSQRTFHLVVQLSWLKDFPVHALWPAVFGTENVHRNRHQVLSRNSAHQTNPKHVVEMMLKETAFNVNKPFGLKLFFYLLNCWISKSKNILRINIVIILIRAYWIIFYFMWLWPQLFLPLNQWSIFVLRPHCHFLKPKLKGCNECDGRASGLPWLRTAK